MPQLPSRPEGRRGMTLSEKIFATHDVEKKGVLKTGNMIRVDVDFVMASELSWTVSFSYLVASG
jgi:homoaconitase/3-isopropylmalate dehydratase large subunit